MKLTIRTRAVEAEGIVSLELAAPDGTALPAFTAGAHIDLHLGNGLTRSYSLVNDPAERHRYVVAINKDPGSRGGSAYIHEHLAPGQALEVGEPRNNFPLVEDAPLVVLIAGGIGITPMYCMAQRLEALGRPWRLYYSARSRRKAAYLQQLQALEDRQGGRVHLHFLDEDGAVPDLQAIERSTPAGAHLYCCGPTPMLQAYEAATAARPPETVHREYFSAQNEAATAGGFEVVLARSHRTVHIGAGKSILDVLLESGIEVSHACQEGVCGACQTTVLEGQPDHRDTYLTPKEKTSCTTMMLCCSGSLGQHLVLDL